MLISVIVENNGPVIVPACFGVAVTPASERDRKGDIGKGFERQQRVLLFVPSDHGIESSKSMMVLMRVTVTDTIVFYVWSSQWNKRKARLTLCLYGISTRNVMLQHTREMSKGESANELEQGPTVLVREREREKNESERVSLCVCVSWKEDTDQEIEQMLMIAEGKERKRKQGNVKKE